MDFDRFTLQCHMAIMNKSKLSVYCGSGPGTNPHFVEGATTPERSSPRNGVSLVYGGGSNGLMGAIAKSTLDHGGTLSVLFRTFSLPAKRPGRVQELIVTRHARTQAA